MIAVQYTVGLAFQGPRLWLIRKNRPAWQAGMLNGIGGHIEDGESPYECMVREFEEECGVRVAEDRWQYFARLEGTRAILHLFSCDLLEDEKPTTKTDEEVVVVNPAFPLLCGVQNLNWLIPLAMTPDHVFTVTQFGIKSLPGEGT